MLNRIVLMGRLTKNPELRHTQSGTPVASFSLAVDRDFKAKRDAESGGAYTPPPAEPGSGGAEFAELTEDDGELPF